MTCIIALEYEGKIYMGGDSSAVNNYDLQVSINPKVFQVGDFLIGYTGSFRMGQLLEYNLKIPKNVCDDDMYYLVTEFIPAVRTCLKDGGYAKIENNQESGGDFLIGYCGKVYEVQNDFQVSKTINKFNSIGCGSRYALGALAALDITHPEKAIIRALEIAEMFSNGVCSPYRIVSI